jgi:hypothetical protein
MSWGELPWGELSGNPVFCLAVILRQLKKRSENIIVKNLQLLKYQMGQRRGKGGSHTESSLEVTEINIPSAWHKWNTKKQKYVADRKLPNSRVKRTDIQNLKSMGLQLLDSEDVWFCATVVHIGI